MELLFVYIDKYRTFEKEKISFSNKFSVDYDAENRKLSIMKNKNFIEIYPKNIIGITGIVGKNASGKTSLLSLIGDKIEDRLGNNENEYFFIYYYGKDKNKQDLFIFESNSPKKYIEMFEYCNQLMKKEKTYSSNIDYFCSKHWISYTFYINNDKLILQKDVMNAATTESIEDDSSIVLFRKDFNNNMLIRNSDTKEEYQKLFYLLFIHTHGIFLHILCIQMKR